MKRINNKEESLKQFNNIYSEFTGLIRGIPSNIRYKEIFTGRDRNIRDMVAQAIGWQGYLLSWHKEGLQDMIPDIPAKGYTWKIADALSLKIWQKFQKIPLDDCLEHLEASEERLIRIIESHTDKELFLSGEYRWTGKKNMMFYFEKYLYTIFYDNIQQIKKTLKKLKITITIEDKLPADIVEAKADEPDNIKHEPENLIAEDAAEKDIPDDKTEENVITTNPATDEEIKDDTE